MPRRTESRIDARIMDADSASTRLRLHARAAKRTTTITATRARPRRLFAFMTEGGCLHHTTSVRCETPWNTRPAGFAHEGGKERRRRNGHLLGRNGNDGLALV